MKILIVDDEPAILKLCGRQLERAGFEVVSAKDGGEAWEAFCAAPFPVVLTDLDMPNVDGFELIRRIRNAPEGSATQIVVISASGDAQQTIDLLDGAVFECLVKPEGVRRIPEVAWRAANAWEKIVSAKAETPPRNGTGSSGGFHDTLREERQFMVVSEHMREVVALALRFHEAPEVPVLIQGETGTGKEEIARLVHQGMDPDNPPFVDVNCAAVSPSLLESELFGYAPGAFTGANHGGQVGKFEMADGGTIFLDELGEMPLGFQSKLLRVLEDKAIRRVGGTERIPINVRTICATNRDIESLVAEGQFREDLYYRLNVGVIRLKPLSERPGAIPTLANFFLERQSERLGKPFQVVHPRAMAKLLKHRWPGNVRELRNVIDQAVVLHSGRILHAEHIDLSYAAQRRENQDPCPAVANWLTPGALLLPESPFDLEQVVDEIVRKALRKNSDNKSKTARYLGLSRSKLLTLLSHAGTTADPA